MTELVLPGVLIEERAEGLMSPAAVTVNNVGVVGTAAKGPIGTPTLIGSYAEAVEVFGAADRWVDGASGALTLTRALEQAYRFGASTVWAVRIAATAPGSAPAAAALVISAPSGDCASLTAKTPGTWGNDITVVIGAASQNAFVRDEVLAGGALAHQPVVPSAVNRVVVRVPGGSDQSPVIVYSDAPGPTQVRIDPATGAVTFGTPPPAGAQVLVSYTVGQELARTVTIRSGLAEETYTVVSGDDLVSDVNAATGGSAIVNAAPLASSAQLPGPAILPNPPEPAPLTGGTNGSAAVDYETGLEALLEVDAHVIVAAGQGLDFGPELARHCAVASSDSVKRDRIAVVGTVAASDRTQAVTAATTHTLDSDRLVIVTPGMRVTDRAQGSVDVTLPGTYTAAAVAGLIVSRPPHISLTNKPLAVDGLEHEFTSAQLRQLVLGRVVAVENRQGFRVVRGITTSTNTAWQQITTRRIVDYTKLGVRRSATPYIGLLNNDRVRGALRATLNSFLASMVADEMLTGYEVQVSATRDDEIRGIAVVDLIIRPTFSIDFIKVTLTLQ